MNSDDNLIRNNHFVDIYNVYPGGGQDNSLHAVYNAHMSDRNVISHNRFHNVASDPVDVRDDSRDNRIVRNLFTRTGKNAALIDWYCRNDLTGFEPRQEEPWSGYGTRGGRGWYVGDYNGDRKDDILRYVNHSGGAEVFLSGSRKTSDGKTVGFFVPAGQWTGAGVRGGEGWYVGNFDGDAEGKEDILRYINGSGGADVYLSTGSSFSYAGTWSGFGTRGGRGWYVGDYDGDGGDDLLRYALSGNGGAQVLLNPGSHFAGPGPHSWSEEEVEGGEGWYVGDYDGDGRANILRYINASGGARVLTQVCTKRTPECPSWNNEFSDNVLDGNRECGALPATKHFQSSTPPPGCPAPPEGGVRFPGGGNLDPDGAACSGPRNGRR